MALPVSRPLWDVLPLIDFVQFPWRFVGRAAMPIAFLAGVPFASTFWAGLPWKVDRLRRLPDLAAVAAVLFLLLEALPNLYPAYCGEEPFPTITAVHTYEHVTGLVGVDPEGSYFPRTVRQRPQGSVLERDYEIGRLPQRFDLAALPEGATVHAAVYRPLSAVIELTTPTPFTARYLSFDFPGWVVEIDGEPVPITPGDPDGLITFLVPVGKQANAIATRRPARRTARHCKSAPLNPLSVCHCAVWRFGTAGF
jgi:hypothetical protein